MNLLTVVLLAAVPALRAQTYSLTVDTATLRPPQVEILIKKAAHSGISFSAGEFGLYLIGPLDDKGRVKLSSRRGVRTIEVYQACVPAPFAPLPAEDQWQPTADVKATVELTVHPLLPRTVVDVIVRRHRAEIVSSSPCGRFGIRRATETETLIEELKGEIGVIDAVRTYAR